MHNTAELKTYMLRKITLYVFYILLTIYILFPKYGFYFLHA